MRHFFPTALLAFSLGCNWPAYDGDGLGLCGAEWTDAVPGRTFSSSVRAVYSTADTVRVVGYEQSDLGELQGVLWTLTRSKDPTFCRLDVGITRSMWVDDDDIYIASSKGLFVTSTIEPCTIKQSIPYANGCNDIWVTGDTVFCACNGEIKIKRPKSAPWLDLGGSVPVAGTNFYTISASASTVVVASNLGQVFYSGLPGFSWKTLNAPSTALLDSRYDENGQFYLVGTPSAFYSIAPGGTAVRPEMADLQQLSVDLVSLWATSGNSFLVGHTIISNPSGPAGMILDSDPNTPHVVDGGYRYLGVHGNSQAVYVVGEKLTTNGNTQGVIRCKRLL